MRGPECRALTASCRFQSLDRCERDVKDVAPTLRGGPDWKAQAPQADALPLSIRWPSGAPSRRRGCHPPARRRRGASRVVTVVLPDGYRRDPIPRCIASQRGSRPPPTTTRRTPAAQRRRRRCWSVSWRCFGRWIRRAESRMHPGGSVLARVWQRLSSRGARAQGPLPLAAVVPLEKQPGGAVVSPAQPTQCCVLRVPRCWLLTWDSRLSPPPLRSSFAPWQTHRRRATRRAARFPNGARRGARRPPDRNLFRTARHPTAPRRAGMACRSC